MSMRHSHWLGVLGLSVLMSACSGNAGAPTSPSATTGGATGAAADGSTLKVPAPSLRAPVAGAQAATTPDLIAEPAIGKFYSVAVTTLRFQVSESESFATITDDGTATSTGAVPVIYRVQRAQRTGARVFWRARAELDSAFGPWSAARDFTVSGSVTPTPTPSPGGGNRTPNPASGQRLPLPDVQGLIGQWTAARPDLFPSQQCPLGVKYVNNPWQDNIIDKLRQIDTRWGYNAKPTRTAADNGGRPVVAAGDEILYNFGSNADEGNTNEVYAVDILESHCGTPRLTWRVFTGEEPVRWTGAGRF